MGLLIIVVIVLLVVMIILAKSICIVPQSQVYIIERLGQFAGELHSGMHFLVPFLDRVRSKMSLAELAYDVPPMDVITKDTVSIRADSFVFYTIFDAKLATYGCRNLREGLSTLAISTLRSVIGKLDLEQCLQSRAEISTQMTRELDEATDKWGIKVTRVEIKTFQPPRNIQDAMERQMKAERERREQLTMAQAAKEECNLLFGLGAKQHGFFFGFRFLNYRNAIRLGIEFCRRTRRLGVEDLDFFVLLSIENGRFFRRLRHRQLW